jgi:hypothetical protein
MPEHHAPALRMLRSSAGARRPRCGGPDAPVQLAPLALLALLALTATPATAGTSPTRANASCGWTPRPGLRLDRRHPRGARRPCHTGATVRIVHMDTMTTPPTSSPTGPGCAPRPN